jgi:hypothetical protein
LQKSLVLASIVFLLLTIGYLPDTPITDNNTAPVQTSIPEYSGIGSKFDVYEFTENESQVVTNAHNDTSFTYLSDWFPTNYYGYRLHVDISNLRKTVNPVSNGDFEEYPEEGNDWTLSHSLFRMVSSATNISGGNPGSCLDVKLLYSKEPFTRASYIDNDFEYISQLEPDFLSVSFDIRFSDDITKANWLQVSVLILDDLGNPKGLWVESTYNFHPTSWTHISFPTFFINGSTTLRVSVEKNDGSNLQVDGHIYFDNFEYLIGSDTTPSEVGLTLNETNIVNTFGSNGEVDIYADSILKEEISILNSWNATQFYSFNSTFSITFDYQYVMYVKTVVAESASSWFGVQINLNPNWIINYTVPSEHIPPGHQGYQFGLYLPGDWLLSTVRDKIGNIITNFHYDSTSQFLLIEVNLAVPGDTFSIHSSSLNYISEIYIQKSSTALGPWFNISLDDYFVIGEYLRIYAVVESLDSFGNNGNVSIMFPNGTLCYITTSITFNTTTNTLTSTAWMVESLCEAFLGEPCFAFVSYNSTKQCGFRSQNFLVMNQAKATLNSPIPNSVMGWEDLIINVTWQNSLTHNFITDATVILRYTDAFNQIRFSEMISNGYGSYSVRLATQDFGPDSLITFNVEFFERGYVNATHASGTSLDFAVTVNTGIPPIIFGIPTIFLLLALLLIFLIGSMGLTYQVYRRRRIIPRQIAHQKMLQKVLDMFNDVTNLSRILVLHRDSGIAIFDPFQERGMDASIMGGFLLAIQAFAIDVANGAKDQELQMSTRLSEITYEGFRVIIHHGQLVRTVLVYKGTPSDTLKEGINIFTKRFEDRYRDVLEKQGNQLGLYSGATDLVEEIFHVSLLFPHSVKAKPANMKLADLESRLHYVALELTKNREFLYLQEIVNSYLEITEENPLELLNAISQLREKNLLVPTDFFRLANSSSN